MHPMPYSPARAGRGSHVLSFLAGALLVHIGYMALRLIGGAP